MPLSIANQQILNSDNLDWISLYMTAETCARVCKWCLSVNDQCKIFSDPIWPLAEVLTWRWEVIGHGWLLISVQPGFYKHGNLQTKVNKTWCCLLQGSEVSVSDKECSYVSGIYQITDDADVSKMIYEGFHTKVLFKKKQKNKLTSLEVDQSVNRVKTHPDPFMFTMSLPLKVDSDSFWSI